MTNSEYLNSKTKEIRIENYEYYRLMEKAEELGVRPGLIVEWLIEECMDEFAEYLV